MFDNVGRKLQTIAVITFVIDLLGLVILGMIAIAEYDEVFGGVIAILAGVFVSPVILYLIYGFGLLVENAEEETKERKKRRANQETKMDLLKPANNKIDDNEHFDTFCIKCGNRLKNTDKFCVKCGWKVECLNKQTN
ncbi:MAG: zinc ribbon domain-containing protein [Clostridia bacterium]|nr:zinc ribbon domain-containing protein [Clostridia bacterium]